MDFHAEMASKTSVICTTQTDLCVADPLNLVSALMFCQGASLPHINLPQNSLVGNRWIHPTYNRDLRITLGKRFLISSEWVRFSFFKGGIKFSSPFPIRFCEAFPNIPLVEQFLTVAIGCHLPIVRKLSDMVYGYHIIILLVPEELVADCIRPYVCSTAGLRGSGAKCRPIGL